MLKQRKRILVVALFAAFLLPPAASAEAGFYPQLDQVKDSKGEVFKSGCLTGHDDLRSKPCRFGDIGSKKKVVLFGDSHAMQWDGGLIRLAKKSGWEVTALTRASCPAAMVRVDRDCDIWRRNSLNRIRRMRPGLVVVASAANRDMYKVRVNGKMLSRAASQPYLVEGMVRTLRKLRRWSGRTVVIRDQVLTPFNVPACLRRNRSKPENCGFRLRRSPRFSYEVAAVRRVPDVRLIDPQPMLCPGGRCPSVDGKYLIYRNVGHLSPFFTAKKYGWLGQKIGNPWGLACWGKGWGRIFDCLSGFSTRRIAPGPGKSGTRQNNG